jgi:dTMP kinase
MPQVSNAPGFLCVIEGGDSSGKSQLLAAMVARLRDMGFDVLDTGEPRGTDIGRGAFELITSTPDIDPATEALLMFAGRADHVSRVILPALDAGKLIVSDRFTESSYAYQGGGRGVDTLHLDALTTLATADLQPHLTLLLDIPVEETMARMRARGHRDHIEARPDRFHEAVRRAYLARSAKQANVVTVDATASPSTVLAVCLDHLLRALKAAGYSADAMH